MSQPTIRGAQCCYRVLWSAVLLKAMEDASTALPEIPKVRIRDKEKPLSPEEVAKRALIRLKRKMILDARHYITDAVVPDRSKVCHWAGIEEEAFVSKMRSRWPGTKNKDTRRRCLGRPVKINFYAVKPEPDA